MATAYCIQADVEYRFGTTNLSTYLDMDGDADAAKKTARMTAAIAAVGAEFEDVLRITQHATSLPVKDSSGAYPTSVVDWVAWAAGIWVYEANGVLDTDKEGTPIHKYTFRKLWCDKVLEEVRTGKRRLDAVI